jgi:AcrR family transcriptional regulator
MRQIQKQATRTKILAVAQTLIETQGYQSTTLRHIAQAAGVAVGTVFVHFESKEDLFYTAFYADLEAIKDRALAEIPVASLPLQLQHIAQTFLHAFAERPALYSHLLQQSLFAPAPWNQRFRAQIEALAQGLFPLYQAAQARGEIAPSVAIPTAIASFFAFYYFALLTLINQQFHPLEPTLQMLNAMIVQHVQGLTLSEVAHAPHL